MEDMDLKDLITLSQEIGQQIQIKAYGQGYKNGFEDGKNAVKQSYYFTTPIRGYEDGKSDVLEEIRAEIDQLPSYVAKFAGGAFAIHIDKEKVLQIIDKYKAESEE